MRLAGWLRNSIVAEALVEFVVLAALVAVLLNGR